MGVIDGGTIGQTAGGQIGGMSIELEQIPCIAPLTHRQTHPARASDANGMPEKTAPRWKAASHARRRALRAVDLMPEVPKPRGE